MPGSTSLVVILGVTMVLYIPYFCCAYQLGLDRHLILGELIKILFGIAGIFSTVNIFLVVVVSPEPELLKYVDDLRLAIVAAGIIMLFQSCLLVYDTLIVRLKPAISAWRAKQEALGG